MVSPFKILRLILVSFVCAIFDFINNLKEGKIDKNADGLVGLINNKLFVNAQVENIENIDDIPYPAFHMLPIEKYFDINGTSPVMMTGGKVLRKDFPAITHVDGTARIQTMEDNGLC